MNPRLSFTLITYNRCDDLIEAVESILEQEYTDYEIVIVSNSTDETPEVFANGGEYDRTPIRFFQFDGRMGVDKARNIAAEKAKGDILVTIDDDAIFTQTDAARQVDHLFSEKPNVGALAFQIRDFHTGEIQEYPYSDKDRDPDERSLTSYYIGCGHAIRRDVFFEAGGYPGDFMYDAEELDFSYRMIDNGHDILYCPSIVIQHKRTVGGRFDDNILVQKQVENRLRFAIQNLPWRYAVPYTIVWTGFSLYQSRFDVRSVGKAFLAVSRDFDDLLGKRAPIKRETVEYLKEHGGRLFY
jgi:GT2 family glycosyltransferase